MNEERKNNLMQCVIVIINLVMNVFPVLNFTSFFIFMALCYKSDFFFRLMVNEHNISCVFDDSSEFERV